MIEFMTLRELLSEKQMTVKELSKRTGIPATTLYSSADKRLGNLKIDLLRTIFQTLGVTREEMRERAAAYLSKFQEQKTDLDETYKCDEHLDSYVHDLGEFLYYNPDHKVLFDSSMEVKKEDVEFVRQMIDRINNSK